MNPEDYCPLCEVALTLHEEESCLGAIGRLRTQTLGQTMAEIITGKGTEE